jgi:hypothetical protein
MTTKTSNILDEDFITTGTFPLVLTGIWAADQTISVKYVKHGLTVTLTIPALTAAANAAAKITTASVIPEELWPETTNLWCPVHILSNSVQSLGAVKITSAGVATLSTSADGTFSASGNGGLVATDITYRTAKYSFPNV